MSQTGSASLTGKNKAGLLMATALGLLDVTSVFFVPAQDGDTPGPPPAILIAGVGLGLITTIAAVYAWRTAHRIGARVVAGSRTLSVILSLPAFYVSGIPASVVFISAVTVIASVIAIAFVLSRPAPESALR
ncbi:hypothetical protein ACFV0T_40100 [Streptomyces sp. NPDC059582]|uniref:hypothetical protein n=1 Tax=Streptomyces sp. NPDC059582 TaxID=3346875 RepID=UPI00367B85F5